ncbi:hypothetical protein A3B49_03785 [Candidatus Daviesbacteria bacterium RIFCSPLOWO2_01_FULL_40_24]|uniref:Nudix hydrolase domain-containing protein n=1 Tax=Candidatus Daviesbacteria bacterium RIFCSPLOWO2_01_FULL_40_24 TaxID=1797787 RepID=A0A1F5MKK4_9BACT|nr:MAG: hypothetical protein A3B49_03785 [Candidatus Daviesbacteria bacterium RIFCSPLOWO2_01_FULL_40_24]
MKQNKQIVIISGCLINYGKFLMVQRDEEECPKAHLKWEFPGGKVDFGETPEESLTREFLEETGRVIKIKELLPFSQTAYWDYDWGTQQTLCFCYLCELINDGEPKGRDHHVKDIRWFTFDEVKSLPSLPGTVKFLNLAQERFMGREDQ